MKNKPKLLDLFCGAEFPNFIFKFTNAKQKPFHISVIEAVMFRLAIEFKVLNSVVLLNSIYMMNLFTLFKAAAKMLCHDKSMLINIAIFISHRIKRTFGRQPKLNISITNLPTAFPIPMLFANLVTLFRSYLTSTGGTSFCLRFAVSEKLPAFLSAVNTSMPNIEMVVSKSSLSSFYNISNLHNLSMAHNGVEYNG